MTAEIVNLKEFRKAKQKAEKKKKAAENRVRFGRDKADQRRREYERARIESEHRENRLDDDGSIDK